MRNRFYVMTRSLLMLILLVLAIGNVLAEETMISPSDMMQSYQDVLSGNRSYMQCNHYDGVYQEMVMPRDLFEWYGFEFEQPLRFEEFCITDLDRDGYPELILRLSEDFGFEVLHNENDQVYGFPFVYRAMEQITSSGDIHGSNGAEDYGWYQVRFDEEKMETLEICWKHSDGENQHQFYIGEEEVSESDFTEFCDGLWKESGPAWIEYTPENLDAAVSGS
ncbi:MAG: hypothetical protein GX123_06070 [Clostridiales bacterium]|nr:hypothetical protein [Clostridiales bacterium]